MERGNSLDNILEDMFANYQTVNHNIIYDIMNDLLIIDDIYDNIMKYR